MATVSPIGQCVVGGNAAQDTKAENRNELRTGLYVYF